MISVQVAEGVLQLLPLEELLLVARCHQKLSEVDSAGAIGVDELQYPLHLVLLQVRVGVIEDSDELIPFDHSISVPIDLIEGLQQELLILVGVELGGDVGVDHGLQLVLELSGGITTWKFLRLETICLPS